MHSASLGFPPCIRVLVVDEHPVVRQSLALLLASAGCEMSAEAGRRADAMALVKKRRPDLAIIDLPLEGEDGGDLIADLANHGVPVLVYSIYSDARRVEAAFAAGAQGFTTRCEHHNVFLDAIRRVAAGQYFVSPQAAAALVENVTGIRPDHSYHKLSSQEIEVYRLLGKGAGTPEIGATLGISQNTVESYYARILNKLKLSGVRELRRYAIAHPQASHDDTG